jgi:class 3 adenylate cyclase/tetratricopeptide (TPR) repeat protein
MDLYAILDQVVDLLRQRQRVTYRALKVQFQLDDEALEALKDELIEAQQLARDENGRILIWAGDAGIAPPAPSASAPIQDREPLTYTPSYLAEKILTSRSALEGERKHVTVLFADLKGSMELLADRDPEEARQLLDPVLQRMMAAVHRYEGTVNQVMGDGIMALFGAPIAHEDHAVRACYAALAMQEAIRAYADQVRQTHQVEIQSRVGLNSGEVVVRTISNDLHMDYSAVGQTTHLAARMEQLAAPGSICLTAETLRLVEGMVQVTPLGPLPVRGLPDPVEVFALIGAGPARTRLQALSARELTRFVGRHTELQALREALGRAGTGHGQLVAVIGEPGVGKSRLFAEFLSLPLTQGWLLLEATAVSYGKATPYLPIRDLLKASFRIEDRDTERVIQEKVDKYLTPDVELQPERSALLALLDVRIEDPEWQALDPSQRRLRILESMRRLLLRQSQVQPLLVSVENLHWIDAGTQAVLDSLVESLPTARLLLLTNYRPEYQHGWGSKTYYTQLRLDPLPPGSANALLQALMGDDGSLSSLKHLLIERTGGNPFFLEESVRTLVEAQVLVEGQGAYRLAKDATVIQVPATVQAVLAARIDRLPLEVKRLLQIAAVIGTEVPLPLLATIAELSEAELHRGLLHLQASEFLYERSLFPELVYTFKHALTHEVAYGSLLHERRQALHARIVEALEALYPDRLAEHVERLAHHAFRGEVWEKALSYYRQAGTKAFARSANHEAVACFEQALRALTHLPERRETVEQAIDLRFELRNALFLLKEHERIFTYLREAEALIQVLDDRQRLGQVSAHLSIHCITMGEHEQALTYGQRTLAIAEALGDVALEVQANFYLGMTHYARGDYHSAIGSLERNVVSLRGDLLRERLGMAGFPAMFSRSGLTRCLAELGAFAAGLAHGVEAVRLAEAVNQPYTLINACYGLGLLYLAKGEFSEAAAVLERGLRLGQTGGVLAWFLEVASALGVTYTLQGHVGEALPLLEQAMEHAVRIRMTTHYVFCLSRLSEAYWLAGQREKATELSQRALALARARKERGFEAYVLRLLGEMHAQQDPLEVKQVEASYRQALALAEELGMRPLQAHCHRGLGTLYVKIDRREQARTALSTALEMYRSMEMTFWLPQTEAVLAQVEGR